MEIQREDIVLKSGKILSYQEPDFEDALNLYQAILEEGKAIKLEAGIEVGHVIKDVICSSLSSKVVRAHVEKCMEKSLYDGSRIVKATWQPSAARGDYMAVFTEVANRSTAPFTKDLFSLYQKALSIVQGHAEKQKT